VRETVAAVRATGNHQLIVLQCTASYPAPFDALNLRAMGTMRRELDVVVGLSDHSRDPYLAPVAAVARGACVVEKHFTFSNQLPGPDHAFAIEPEELRQMISYIRACEAALGTGEKRPLAAEEELRRFARRSLFTTAPIARGATFTRANIAVLRAGKAGQGLSPAAFDEILGKRARRDLEPDVPITAEDFE
jgi:sialic acid synthase SpsE